MKTHIVEQDKNGFITPIKNVWLVRQTQPVDDYDQRTIAVFTDKQDALNLARRLNKVYGQNCIFDEDWDLVEYDMQDDPHYYDIECQELNPAPSDFLWTADE